MPVGVAGAVGLRSMIGGEDLVELGRRALIEPRMTGAARDQGGETSQQYSQAHSETLFDREGNDRGIARLELARGSLRSPREAAERVQVHLIPRDDTAGEGETGMLTSARYCFGAAGVLPVRVLH